MKFKTLLNDEIRSELESLKKMELGTETYKCTVDGLTRLIDRSIEIEKTEFERDEKIESRENDYDLRVKTMNDEQKDRMIRNTIAVVGIVIPTLVTIWGTKASFRFEQEGTVTTIMGRGFINKLLPKK